MDDDQKAAKLIELWNGTSARIVERRSYEWKIAFGVWGAQLVAMGVLLAHSNDVRLRWFLFVVYLLGGLIIGALHASYVWCFVRVRNKEDACQAKVYEKAVVKCLFDDLQIDDLQIDDLQIDDLQKVDTNDGPSVWSWRFEVGVTLVLAVLGPVAILAAT